MYPLHITAIHLISMFYPPSVSGLSQDGTVDGGQRRRKSGKFSHSGSVMGRLFMNDDFVVGKFM